MKHLLIAVALILTAANAFATSEIRTLKLDIVGIGIDKPILKDIQIDFADASPRTYDVTYSEGGTNYKCALEIQRNYHGLLIQGQLSAGITTSQHMVAAAATGVSLFAGQHTKASNITLLPPMGAKGSSTTCSLE